jgi:hypothetical protein
MRTRRLSVNAAVVVAALAAMISAGAASGTTIPSPILEAVHGRVAGWTKTAGDWFVVYVDRAGRGRCGLDGASWRIALVETARIPVHVVSDRRVAGAMCGNELSWVRAGRFSDGRHREVAFELRVTPSIGAHTHVYRVDGDDLRLLATFGGDSVTLRRGIAIVGYQNRGRSPHGEIEDVYRFVAGRYRLVRRR